MKFLHYLNLFACMVSTALVGTNEVPAQIYAADKIEKIENTNPFEDLIQDDKFKVDYLNGAYSFDHTSDVQFMNFAEYKYENTYSSAFGLYLYFYNPNDLKPINVFSDRNLVKMSIDEVNYKMYQLIPVSKSTDEIENMFYKFKVDIDETFHSKLESDQREYDLVSFQLSIKGESNPKEIEIGTKFFYTGYAAGCNGNETSTLDCLKKGYDALHLPVHGGTVRSGYVNDLLTECIDLHYVYFEIPNKYINDYGQPYSISYEYYDYPLDKGIYNIRNHDYFVEEPWDSYNDEITPDAVVGHDPHYYVQDINFWDILFNRGTAREDVAKGSMWRWEDLDVIRRNEFSKIPQIGNRLFRKDEWDSPISSSEVKDLLKQYPMDYFSSTSREDAYSGLLTSTIDDIEPPADIDPGHPNLSWWGKLANQITYGKGQYGRTQDSGNTWSNKSAYEIVTSIDDENGTLYTIDSNDVADFNEMYQSSLENDTTMMILRFHETEYWTAPVTFHRRAALRLIAENIGYSAFPHIIDDFRVITLGFEMNDYITIIPVVSDPIQIVPSLIGPGDDRPDVLDDYDKLFGKDAINLKLILGIIGGILLIVGGYKLITLIDTLRLTRSSIKANNTNTKIAKQEHKAEKKKLKEQKTKKKGKK